MPRSLVNALAVVGVLAVLVLLTKLLTYGESEAPQIAAQHSTAVANLPPPPAIAPPPANASAPSLRDMSSRMIEIDAEQFVGGIWTALMTIENTTHQPIKAFEHPAACVLFDAAGQRVGMTLPIGPTFDLQPGESFSVQVVAAAIPTDRPPVRHECRFQG